jgi:beta-glucanase (GH16 family)
MFVKPLAAALLAAASCTAVAAPAAAPDFHWPGGTRAAVSLAYDDALDSQLDNAIPALDQYGLKGSFYLQLSNPSVAARMADWRAAAARGHELGNHSLFHQCARSQPGRDFVEPRRNLDTTSVEQMQDQVLLANTMLAAIDGKRERTFTVPCGDRMAAGRDYLPAVAPAFVGVKALMGSGVTASMAGFDRAAVQVLAPVGMSGAQLIALVKEAGDKGTMVNFTFHGIGGDYLATSNEAHRELLAFLAANRRRYWTTTFVDIMQHVRREQAAVPTQAQALPAAPAGWQLDWHDEFDGAALDHAKWVEETGDPKNGNDEKQFYTARPENLRVENGMLVIEARREQHGGMDYTSARIKTQGLVERTYGRYEARIKIPRGQGIWPAFWMLGADCGPVPWPHCGEIDIMENIGKEPAIVHGTLHGPGYSGEHAFGKPQALDKGTYADDFHVYAVEWEPGEIRWYRDAILYHTARPALVKGVWPFERPFFVILNLAVGGYWPGYADATTPLPQQMLVDWVRVYQRR